MPWRETNPQMERMKFIVALESGELTMAALCRQFGISRETGYEWKRRFEQGGVAALEDRPPVAGTHKNQTPDDVADRLVNLRKQHPTWGPKKLRKELEGALEKEVAEGRPKLVVPATSTIGEILKRRGMVAPPKKRLRVPPSPSRLAAMSCPNAVWTADHKGDFALAGGGRCHPLTIADGYSRYLLKCEALTSTSDEAARPHFERAFQEHGLPVVLRTDNGSPFASASGPGGLTRFSVWLVKLGIRPERIEPGHPEQNGRHERMHRTLEEAIEAGKHDLGEQQRRFDVFRGVYNHERPHEALGMRPPAAVYETSWRPYPAILREPEYDLDMVVRRVQPNGVMSWRGQAFSVGKVLGAEPVGLRDFDDDRWLLYFGPLLLGIVDARGKVVRFDRRVPQLPAAPLEPAAEQSLSG